MFVVPESDAAAIRAVFHAEGELSAAIELRRRFKGITDNAKARVRADHRRLDAAGSCPRAARTAPSQLLPEKLNPAHP